MSSEVVVTRPLPVPYVDLIDGPNSLARFRVADHERMSVEVGEGGFVVFDIDALQKALDEIRELHDEQFGDEV